MDTAPDSSGKTPEELSALMDGELSLSRTLSAAAQWRDDADVRADWHAYHLIGDVLRSGDLASTVQHDEAFLQSLRQRLSQEPVGLAPGPVSEAPSVALKRAARAWPSVAAVALLAVGVAVWTQRELATGTDAPAVLAERSPVAPVVQVSASVPGVEAPEIFVVRGDQGPLLRDAQLDRYLDAHQQFGGASALVGPAGFVRRASAQPPQR